MKSLRAIANVPSPAIATGALLLPWLAAVAAAEQTTSYTETKLTASDADVEDEFGYSVAISGDTAVIGADQDDDLGPDSGSAYIFERDPRHPTKWTETAKLLAAEGAPSDYFGYSVAISGAVAVIGAYRDDDLGDSSGSAYVFERHPVHDTVWTQTAKLTAADGAPEDDFGYSVAISGGTVVIGARDDDDRGEGSGSAYVFERHPVHHTVWTQTAKLTATDGEAGDWFGRHVQISGDTALIGAFLDDDLGSDSGSVYVFERDPFDSAVWTQTAKLTATDGEAGDWFGIEVAISGDTALIGAYQDDDLGIDSGAAYVFERHPVHKTVWTQTAKLTADDGVPFHWFGASVAISEDIALVGSWRDEDFGAFSGAAYFFERDPIDPAVWTQIAKLTASDADGGHYFGFSVAIAGQEALIGAPRENDPDDSGAAYVYSPPRCEVELALQPFTLRAGEELQVAVDLHHRRPVTVTVPFLLWVEDGAGRVIIQKTSPPVTLEPGDHRKLRLAVTLPPSLPPGTYRVLVGVRRMQQGIAWGSRQFEIVE